MSTSSSTTKKKKPMVAPSGYRWDSSSSGTSSFPRRLPLNNSDPSSSSPPLAREKQSSSFSSSSSSSQQQQPGGKGKDSTGPHPDLDTMARRLTRFYTTNFERRPVITLCVTNSLLSAVGDACAQLIPILGAAAGADIPGWNLERTFRFAMFGFSIGPMIEKWNRFLEYRFPLRPISQVFPKERVEDDDPNSPAFMEGLKKAAEKEGFKVSIDRGDAQQGQQYASNKIKSKNTLDVGGGGLAAPHRRGSSRSAQLGAAEKGGSSYIVDPQHVAMPNTGQPGQVSVVALFQRVAADQLFMAPLGLAVFISTMGILEGLEWDQLMERYRQLYLPILLINWQIWPFVQIINFRYLPLRYRVPFSASLGVLWTVFLSFKNAKVA